MFHRRSEDEKEKKVTYDLDSLYGSGFLIILLPILVMILTSFKTTGEINSAVFHFLPESMNLDNYKAAMSTGSWLIYFEIPLVITLVSIVFSLLFNSVAGYAFARLHFKGSKVLFTLLLVGLMMPPQVTMPPYVPDYGEISADRVEMILWDLAVRD